VKREFPVLKAPIPSELNFRGMPVYRDENAPLTKPLIEDGKVVLDENGNEKRVPVFCIVAMGNVLVHPDRWDEFEKLLSKKP
jgi:hypothetical protein